MFDVVRRRVAAKKAPQQEMVFKTWGGKRKGAGRPPKGERSSEPHKKRPAHQPNVPVHIVARVVADIRSLRKRHIWSAIRHATIVTARREDFRIVHFSVQGTHLHLIIEAENRMAIARGMQGFQISAARAINAAITKRTGVRRTGQVFADRYHLRALKTPREVRNAIAYVLNNWRHHDEDKADVAKKWMVDPFSSGIQFTGWKELEHAQWMWEKRATYKELWVWLPRTWLLGEGWKRHGLIRTDEVPGPLRN
jgi:REP element-mobilizing transposase RayT